MTVDDVRLRTEVGSLNFANPIGLAAGFDKNGRAISMLGAVGFGHTEIGSISAFRSEGNRRPRLFRIPRDSGIVVHYGVPNEGAAEVQKRLNRHRGSTPLGINLVKTNDPERPAIEPDVYEDYATSFKTLQPFASYVALNLSCPNSAADMDFFDELRRLHCLLERLEACVPVVPVFLKLKPIKDPGTLREIVAIADDFPFIAGFAINLPAGKPSDLNLSTPSNVLARMPGAVGGPPARELIDQVLATLRAIIGPTSRYKLIAAGGVSSPQDAYRKIRLGATLVQLYTGLVYLGPGLVKEILIGLLQLIERDGFASVTQAVGVDVDGRVA